MNEYRLESKQHFHDILSNEPIYNSLSTKGRELLVTRLESSCHNANVDYAKNNHIPAFWNDETFVEHYSMIIYRVSINLDPTSSVNLGLPSPFGRTLMNRVLITAIMLDPESQSLLDKIVDQDRLINHLGVDLKHVGYMGSQELNSFPCQRYLDEIELRATQKIDIKTTKMYECSQCHKRDATFYRLQTRSGDEGYTTFIQCCICEHIWTMR